MQSESKSISFYGLDGDKIGSVIEVYIIQNDLEKLSEFSEKVSKALEEIKNIVLDEGGYVIFCAGDSILFQGDFSENWCQKLIDIFVSITGCTTSIGIGLTTTEAYLALKLAKATGGGKVQRFLQEIGKY